MHEPIYNAIDNHYSKSFVHGIGWEEFIVKGNKWELKINDISIKGEAENAVELKDILIELRNKDVFEMPLKSLMGR